MLGIYRIEGHKQFIIASPQAELEALYTMHYHLNIVKKI
jgi:hypothetical protein